MASRKRFIDAELFSDEWFIDLEPKYKLAFIFLITNCGHDGIWKVSQKLLSFNIGENVELVGLKRALGSRVIELENGRLWFIPKFILFQYGENLSINNNTLKQFFLADAKYGLLKYITAPSKPLPRGAQDKDKDKDKVKDKEEVKEDVIEKVVESSNEPTIDEVKKYFKSMGYPVKDGENFYSYYSAQGWETTSGMNIRKTWHKKVIGWMNNQKQFTKYPQNERPPEPKKELKCHCGKDARLWSGGVAGCSYEHILEAQKTKKEELCHQQD